MAVDCVLRGDEIGKLMSREALARPALKKTQALSQQRSLGKGHRRLLSKGQLKGS